MGKTKKLKQLDPDLEIRKLGARFKQLRKQAGYSSAEEFAHEYQLTRSGYGKIEQGRNIEFLTLIRLLNIHGISYEDFFSTGFD